MREDVVSPRGTATLRPHLSWPLGATVFKLACLLTRMWADVLQLSFRWSERAGRQFLDAVILCK